MNERRKEGREKENEMGGEIVEEGRIETVGIRVGERARVRERRYESWRG